jgi:ABC-type multidrug transport system ATPase subunit
MPPYISIGGYSDPPLLSHLSVEAGKGELVALVGPPGSGKSNLIKSIAGIRSITRGSIRIMGARPGSERSRQGTVFVFQNWNFMPDLSIRFQLERKIALYRGTSSRSTRRDIHNWCKDLELADILDAYPGQLNRSQLQVLSLAPLALTKPSVAILDEPLANTSSLMTSSAIEVILSVLEGGAVLALMQARSPLVSRADSVVTLL